MTPNGAEWAAKEEEIMDARTRGVGGYRAFCYGNGVVDGTLRAERGGVRVEWGWRRKINNVGMQLGLE